MCVNEPSYLGKSRSNYKSNNHGCSAVTPNGSHRAPAVASLLVVVPLAVVIADVALVTLARDVLVLHVEELAGLLALGAAVI